MTEELRNEIAQIMFDIEEYIELCKTRTTNIDPQKSDFQYLQGKMHGLENTRNKLLDFITEHKQRA